MSDSRLFKIIYHLLDKGHATATELAAKFEVSTRTPYSPFVCKRNGLTNI